MRHRFCTALICLLVVLLCDGSPVSARPTGPEFQVNKVTKNRQHSQSSAMLDDGFGIVCWTTTNDQGFTDIKCRFVAPDGFPEGPEFTANEANPGNQDDVAVAPMQNGGFIATWASFNENGPGWSVVTRRFGADGKPDTGQLIVGGKDSDDQIAPSVTQLSNGGYVVTWVSLNQDTGDQNVFAKVFDKNDNAVTADFLVNKITKGDQNQPVVVALPLGGFVISWTSFATDGSDSEVMAQRFNNNGTRLDKNFQVNTRTANFQVLPAITFLSNGGFVIAWQSVQQNGFADIFGQRFNPNGSRAGREFRINTHTANWQERPVICSIENALVAFWESAEQDGSGRGIFGRIYSMLGKAITKEFRANTTRQGDQAFPSLAGSPDGRRFMAFWSAFSPNGLDSEIIGRPFLSPDIPPP